MDEHQIEDSIVNLGVFPLAQLYRREGEEFGQKIWD
jgi:hypothetical protein